MQITHDEEGERRWAGLAVNDYADGSTDLDAWERADAMPEGPQKVAELKRLQERYGGKRRVFLGRQRDRAARLIVNDAAGHPRLLLEVAPEGAAQIRFLDAGGKVVRTETVRAGSDSGMCAGGKILADHRSRDGRPTCAATEKSC